MFEKTKSFKMNKIVFLFGALIFLISSCSKKQTLAKFQSSHFFISIDTKGYIDQLVDKKTQKRSQQGGDGGKELYFNGYNFPTFIMQGKFQNSMPNFG